MKTAVEQDPKLIGQQGKSDKRSLGVSLNDHISNARRSITVMTSSWADSTPGPLGLNIPEGMLSAREVRQFNEKHAGKAFAVISSSKSHFMTGSSFTELLYGLYSPAFDRQRTKYGLNSSVAGKFLADAWTGFRSSSDGEPVERGVWESLNKVSMPILGWTRMYIVFFFERESLIVYLFASVFNVCFVLLRILSSHFWHHPV